MWIGAGIVLALMRAAHGAARSLLLVEDGGTLLAETGDSLILE